MDLCQYNFINQIAQFLSDYSIKFGIYEYTSNLKGMKNRMFNFKGFTSKANDAINIAIEEAGKDHLVMSNPRTGQWSLILLIYLNKDTLSIVI